MSIYNPDHKHLDSYPIYPIYPSIIYTMGGSQIISMQTLQRKAMGEPNVRTQKLANHCTTVPAQELSIKEISHLVALPKSKLGTFLKASQEYSPGFMRTCFLVK